MAHFGEKFIHASIHDFKAHFAQYVKLVHGGQFKGIIVKRYTTPVGLFVPLTKPDEKPQEMKDIPPPSLDDMLRIFGAE